MRFSTWLDTLIEEKGIDPEQVLEVQSQNGTDNFIPVGCVMDAMKQASPADQNIIKSKLVIIDFKHGDILHFFRYVAAGMARDM